MKHIIFLIFLTLVINYSFLTGSVALVFTALGVIIAGIVITKFKPSARKLGGWNVVVGFFSALGMLTYIFLGCNAADTAMIVKQFSK